MSNNQKSSKTRRGTEIIIVVCFVTAIVMAAAYALNGIRETKQQELAKLEEENKSEIVNAEELIIQTKENQEEETEITEQEEEETKEETEEEVAVQTDTSSVQKINLDFTENSQMLWPVNGKLLMGYSMDQTVYFATLDQYKYNPAMIISGAEGDQVIAGAPGIVKSIDISSKTGTTVNVDLGNGYEAFYGQLKDVPLNVGDYVTATTVVGYVAQPTKYYVEEGTNIYFEMRKDGQPVDPLNYIGSW